MLVALTIATLPTLCPNLQVIYLCPLPRDLMIIAAVSNMLLTCSPNTLWCIDVDSLLTEEACDMISRLPDLCQLLVVIEKGASLPSVVLPNLTNLAINWNHDSDLFWMFHGATFGKLEVITFNSTFKPTNDFRSICDFLETFDRVMLAVSAQNTLSEFYFHTSCSCNPNYSSLLPFTQLRYLIIGSSCGDGCTSRVDDDIITNLTQVMPELEILLLGDMPCHEILTGVTVKVLVVLAHHC